MTQQICAQKIDMRSDGHELFYDRNFFFGGGSNILFPVSGYASIKQLFDMLSQNDEHTITLKQATGN